MITKSIKLIAHKIWKNLEKIKRKFHTNHWTQFDRHTVDEPCKQQQAGAPIFVEFLLNFVFENCLKQNILISDFAGSPLVSPIANLVVGSVV